MFSPAFWILLLGGTYVATVGGSILHFGFDFLKPHRKTNDWIHTPEDINEEWNKGLFWHKYTLLRYGKYPSENLPMTSGNDKENTDALIDFCHRNRNSSNTLLDPNGLARVRELCHLPKQETLLKKYMELWNWEYNNNARIVLVESTQNHRGFYLSFLLGFYSWNTHIGGRHSPKKLDVLLETFNIHKDSWTTTNGRYLQDSENTKKLIPLTWRTDTSSWNYMDLGEERAQEKAFFGSFSGTQLY